MAIETLLFVVVAFLLVVPVSGFPVWRNGLTDYASTAGDGVKQLIRLIAMNRLARSIADDYEPDTSNSLGYRYSQHTGELYATGDHKFSG